MHSASCHAPIPLQSSYLVVKKPIGQRCTSAHTNRYPEGRSHAPIATVLSLRSAGISCCLQGSPQSCSPHSPLNPTMTKSAPLQESDAVVVEGQQETTEEQYEADEA